MRYWMTFVAISLLTLLAGRAEPAAGQVQAADLFLDGTQFTPAAAADTYLSGVLDAPLAYNIVVPQWQGAGFALSLRTGVRRSGMIHWEEWIPLEPSNDMKLEGATAEIGQFIAAPPGDQVAQVRLVGAPRLEQLRLTFIDSTSGPSQADVAATADRGDTPDGDVPKPPVVDRDQWCNDPRCNYTDGLEYESVTHLILHHTAIDGYPGDPITHIRAVWYYHAITLDWGDIGYNFLVDDNGVLYEGHLGGDDVIGTHAAGANRGSLGLSMMGLFTDDSPPPAMLDGVAALFAWKADQKDIDVYDASKLPNVSWGLPHVMGHRDVYGTTQCPGDAGHVVLPALRDEVAALMGFTPPHLYYDEEGAASGFSRGGSDWVDGPGGCGFAGHSFYTLSTTDPSQSDHWAQWQPQVALPGHYDLEMYAAYCNNNTPDTRGAQYAVTAVDGSHNIVVDQAANIGMWTSLGDYPAGPSSPLTVRVTDLTTTDSGRSVWVDAVRLLYLPPQSTPLTPQPNGWYSSTMVTFAWSIANEASLVDQRLQVSVQDDFNALLVDEPLPGNARSSTHTLAAAYDELYWRLVLGATNGDTFIGPTAQFSIDDVPPVSAVTGLYGSPGSPIFVTWEGTDDASGVVGYNIEYRLDGTASWMPWLVNTDEEYGFFTMPDPAAVYWFRSQARDAAGNLEAAHAGDGDISTAAMSEWPAGIYIPLSIK